MLLSPSPDPLCPTTRRAECGAPQYAGGVSIIIVSFNTRQLTLAAISSLNRYEPDAELIVVDNASSDGSATAIRDAFPNVRLLELSRNIGFGRANVVGCQAASHDILILFNSDAEVSDDALSRCACRLRNNRRLGAVTPRLRGADGNEQASRHPVPSFRSLFRRAVFGEPLVTRDTDFWIPGTCLILKRSAVEEVGGLFNPELFMYWEDADLCARLKSGGYELAVAEDASVLHLGGASGGGASCTAKLGLHEWYTFGRHHWFARHRPGWEAAALWMLEFVDAFRCVGRALIRREMRHQLHFGRVLLVTLFRRLAGRTPTFALSPNHALRDAELLKTPLTTAVSAVSLLTPKLGAVVIGRNEGERLQRCLESLVPTGIPIVYVDSGSTDGSRDRAAEAGATVVELDLSIPFSAARARNAGLETLSRLYPDIEFIQFLDGDCELTPGWLDEACEHLTHHPKTAIYCGTLREKYPEKTVYNRLCQMEWRRPSGSLAACGGIFAARVCALKDVGGFDATLIAGEEPELCLRLRRTDHEIIGSPSAMAVHDADIHRFGQWWKRSVRAGWAYTEAWWRHGAGPERFRRREVQSIVLWGILLPLIGVAAAWVTCGISLALPLLGLRRVARRSATAAATRGERPEDARVYGRFTALSKFPQAVGFCRCLSGHLLRQQANVIEYKDPADL